MITKSRKVGGVVSLLRAWKNGPRTLREIREDTKDYEERKLIEDSASLDNNPKLKEWQTEIFFPDREAGGMKNPPVAYPGLTVHYQIGEGSTSKVYAASSSMNGDGAIKVYDFTDKARERMKNRGLSSVKILQRESRPGSDHVISAMALTDQGGKHFLWMPRAKVSLETVLEFAEKDGQVIDLDRALKWSRHIALGLRTLHRTVTHGDIKPDNLMFVSDGSTIPDYRLAITDLGTASMIDPSEWSANPRDNIGFKGTRDPQNFTGEHKDGSSDSFALGAILGRILIGSYPYQKRMESSKNPQVAMETLGENEANGIIRDYVSGLPPYVQSFLIDCLSYDSSRRPQNGEELVNKLEKMMKKHEASKPGARAKRWGLGMTALTLAGILGLATHGQIVSLSEENKNLEKKVSESEDYQKYNKKGRVVSAVLNAGKDRDVNSMIIDSSIYMDAKEFKGWLDLLKDPRTATAAYFDSQTTFDAVMKANGSTDYNDIRGYLSDDRDSKAFCAVLEFADPVIDNWMRFSMSPSNDPGSIANDRWKQLKSLYEAKQALDKEQGEGMADKVLSERREKLRQK